MIEYTLDNGEELNKESPETFFIPARAQRDTLLRGELVKLIFRMSLGDNVQVERMWVIIKSRTDTGYIGTLDNDPFCTKELQTGAEVVFGPEHVIQIYEEPHQA
jgi:uncharacterized protein YegJ (DUF2314 family)